MRKKYWVTAAALLLCLATMAAPATAYAFPARDGEARNTSVQEYIDWTVSQTQTAFKAIWNFISTAAANARPGNRFPVPKQENTSPRKATAHTGNVTSREDVPFGRNTADITYKDTGSPAPVLLLVHGGSWVKGDKDDMDPYEAYFANAGFYVISINYQLYSAYNLTEMTDDVEEAIRHAGRLDAPADTDNIFVAGYSSGAHLAACAVAGITSSGGLGQGTIRGVILVGCPGDISMMPTLYFATPEFNYLDPVKLVRPGLPAYLFFHGTSDSKVPIGMAESFYDRLKAAGNDAEFHACQGMGHGIDLEKYGTTWVQWMQARTK